jgi:peptidyl-Lys metalloendopeptidase
MRSLANALALVAWLLVTETSHALADIGASQKACTPQQSKVVSAAIKQAREGLQKSIASLANPTSADKQRFERWFGSPSNESMQSVRQIFERSLALVSFQAVWCPVVNSPELQWSAEDVAAYYPPTPNAIYLAPFFFDFPTVGNPSQAGAIVHELTHVKAVGDTDDVPNGYGNTNAEKLAKADPAKAKRNADNYRLYMEDLLWGL